MNHSGSTVVRVVAQKEQAALSKGQRLFNRLVEKINKERKRLAEWQATIPRYQQQYASEYDPLLQTYNGLRADLVRLFDKVYVDKSFNKNDKAKLRDLICTIGGDLLADNGDEDLKRIYNKHGRTDFDAEVEQQKSAVKFMMEDILGVDLGDEIDFSSPEKMMAHVSEKMRDKLTEEETIRQAQEARRGKRKKSAKALAKVLSQ